MKIYVVAGYDEGDSFDRNHVHMRTFMTREKAEDYSKSLLDDSDYDYSDVFEQEVDGAIENC